MWAHQDIYHPDPAKPHFQTELEINDIPQRARWRVESSHCYNTVPECFAECKDIHFMFRRIQPSSLCWKCLPCTCLQGSFRASCSTRCSCNL